MLLCFMCFVQFVDMVSIIYKWQIWFDWGIWANICQEWCLQRNLQQISTWLVNNSSYMVIPGCRTAYRRASPKNRLSQQLIAILEEASGDSCTSCTVSCKDTTGMVYMITQQQLQHTNKKKFYMYLKLADTTQSKESYAVVPIHVQFS